MFINLGNHSYYSLLMSSMSIDDIINHAQKQKQTHVALVDLNNLSGAMEFYQKAKLANLIPVIGLQIDYQNTPVVLIAKNHQGYLQLVKVASYIGTNTSYDLNNYLEHIYLLVPDIKECNFLKHHADVYSTNPKSDNPIAYHDCYFEQEQDIKYLKALYAIKNDQLLSEVNLDNVFQQKFCWNTTQAEKYFSVEALKNLDKLVSNCQWELPAKQPINFIKYDQKVNSKILLQTKCKEGLKQRLNSANAPVTYIERLAKELSIIDDMHFNDYFLVVQDYVDFAKRKGILVGPGRGSAAGSLVAYVLGITELDPIAYNLIFERFLNPERTTMPDIDIDFMDNRRNEIIEYLFDKYGKEHVAHIITFQHMKAKMAIRDAGRILEINLQIVNNISKLINMEYDLDLKGAIANDDKVAAQAQRYEELFDIASKLINFPRQVGLHAAGVVISNTKLEEIVPIQISSDGINSTQYSMEYLEALGLIKMDILGLVNLTTISETIKLINSQRGVKIDLDKINLNDSQVFRQLSSGDTVGIFQLESPGMRNLIMKVKPTSIEDISVTSALFRPGPQQNIPTYLANKSNPKQIQYLNDEFKKVLSSTYNIIVYQEQVIEIVQRVANFSLAEADLFRRAISKKNVTKLASLEQQFMSSGLKNHYHENELKQIFDFIMKFANYGFNHSHSLAYSYISYWMAYLKTHYPLEYFTVLLASSENSVDKISLYIQSARAIGINVLPPDINQSEYSFSIKNKSIIFGLNAIKGIGHETIMKIFNVRQELPKHSFGNYMQAITLLGTNGIGIKVIESLIKVGAFDSLLENKSRWFLLTNLVEIYEKSKTTTASGELLIKPMLKEVMEDFNIKTKLNEDAFNLLGVSFEEHPLIKIKKQYQSKQVLTTLANAVDINNVYRSLIILVSTREIKTKNGDSMAFAKIEDETKVVDAVIFPGPYNKVKELMHHDHIYLATYKMADRGPQILDLKEYQHE